MYASYRYQQLAFQEWKDMYKEGKLNEFQSEFYKACPPERLYDLSVDPEQKHNLANNPEYASILKNLRKDQCKYLVKKADIGFFPETLIFEEGFNNPDQFGNDNRNRIKKFIEIANLQIGSFDKAKSKLEKSLNSKDDVERWWALTTCAYFGSQAKSLEPFAVKLLKDSRSFNRARAMVFLARLGVKDNDMNVYSILKFSKTGAETMLVLNDFTYLVEQNLIPAFKLTEADTPKECKGVDKRIKYMNQCYESQNK